MQVEGMIGTDRMLGYNEVELRPRISPQEIATIRRLGFEKEVVATARCFPTQIMDYTLGDIVRQVEDPMPGGILFGDRNDAVRFIQELHDGITRINGRIGSHGGPTAISDSPIVSSVLAGKQHRTDNEHRASKPTDGNDLVARVDEVMHRKRRESERDSERGALMAVALIIIQVVLYSIAIWVGLSRYTQLLKIGCTVAAVLIACVVSAILGTFYEQNLRRLHEINNKK